MADKVQLTKEQVADVAARGRRGQSLAQIQEATGLRGHVALEILRAKGLKGGPETQARAKTVVALWMANATGDEAKIERARARVIPKKKVAEAAA